MGCRAKVEGGTEFSLNHTFEKLSPYCKDVMWLRAF